MSEDLQPETEAVALAWLAARWPAELGKLKPQDEQVFIVEYRRVRRSLACAGREAEAAA